MSLRLFGQRAFCVLLLAVFLLITSVAFGQTSSSLSGVVQDSQSQVIPNAKVTVTDPATVQKFDTTTGGEGTFTFPTLQPGTYTLTVEAQGFKQLVKTGIVINTADRQNAGTLSLEPGDISSTIEVTADAAQLALKTESGEQGETITGKQVRDLSLNGRNYLDLTALIPGIVSEVNGQVANNNGLNQFNVNGARGTQNNLTVDGSTNVDTGSNGVQHVSLNIDTIAEFKVLTSNYQAQYGRSSGGQVIVTTKGGTNQFHGTGYLFHRHEQFNANTFFNNANTSGGVAAPLSRSLYRYNYTGYNVSGPVILPRFGEGGKKAYNGKNKLFFFFGQDFAQQLIPATSLRQYRLPTAAEAAGDFSQTFNGTGTSLVFLKDPAKTGTCGAANTAANPGACFVYQGRLNVIDPARINSSGQAILRYFNGFANNASALPQFNYTSQLSTSAPRREETLRFDYNLSDKTLIYARYTRDTAQQLLPYGIANGPASSDIEIPVLQRVPAKNASLNITSTLSPTMVNEFIFGPSQNSLSYRVNDPTRAPTLGNLGLPFTPPYPYSPDQAVDVVFQGFTGINNTSIGTINGYSRYPYNNSNTTFDFTDNLSKVLGTHTAKFGLFFQRSRKDQTAGNSMRITFGNSATNPVNAGNPYANALLGNFDTLVEPTRTVYQGQYRYSNIEWYAQDNWKVNKRLTLDYGMRFSYIQPQYDARLQATFFNPSLYDPAKAVRLYRPADANSTNAFDPANPTVRNLPGYLVGRIVPNSGDPFDGIALTSNGYTRGGTRSRMPQLGPAFGFAYDVFGNQQTVVRGGYRIAYDRVSGNDSIFRYVENPPSLVQPTFNNDNLNTVGTRSSSGQIALGTIAAAGVNPNSKITNVQSFSLQVQQNIGFATVLSIAYVGSLSRHLTVNTNINYIPYGATFQRENQDPTRFTGGIVPACDTTVTQIYRDKGLCFDGSKALTAQFLRRYQGYNDILYRDNSASANYHSLQVTVQRRFTKSLFYGLSYTYSKVLGTASGDNNTVDPIDSRHNDYGPLDFDRRHLLAINYVYNVPRLSAHVGFSEGSMARKVVGAVFDNFQISGISQFRTGAPTQPTFSLLAVNPNGTTQTINLGQRITGSYTQAPLLQLTGNPTGSQTRTNWFDYTQLRLPDVGTQGRAPNNYLYGPGTNVTNLSLFKNIPFTNEKSRYVQLRFEFFNVFNHPQFNGFNGALQFVGDPNNRIRSDFSNYAANQQASPTTVSNTRGGTNLPNQLTDRLGRAVGEFNSQPAFVSGNRVVQLAIKVYF